MKEREAELVEQLKTESMERENNLWLEVEMKDGDDRGEVEEKDKEDEEKVEEKDKEDEEKDEIDGENEMKRDESGDVEMRQVHIDVADECQTSDDSKTSNEVEEQIDNQALQITTTEHTRRQSGSTSNNNRHTRRQCLGGETHERVGGYRGKRKRPETRFKY